MGKIISRIAYSIAACLLLPGLAHSAGLGRLTVQSALGEPLKAEVELVSVQAGEIESLVARLASQEVFRQANVELNAALFDIRFAIERRGSDRYVVTLTSARPMNEPFLGLLLELDWAGGRLVREYTFLLDPPEYRGPAVARSVAPVAPPLVQALPAPVPAPAPAQPAAPAVAAAPPPAAAPARPAAPAARAPQSTYEVRRGDTLSGIALRQMPEGVSLQQMLVALYRNNESAFVNNNMNRLRTGAILNIPDRASALAVPGDEARRVVSAQTADFAEFQRSVGAAVGAAGPRQEPTRQATGRIGEGAAEQPARPGPAAQDQLRLSRPADTRAGAAADDAAAKDKALREAMERIAVLEKNLDDLRRIQQGKGAPAAQPPVEAGKAEAARQAPPAAPTVVAKAQPAEKADAGKTAPPAEEAKAPPPADQALAAPDAAKPAPPAPKAAAKAAPPAPPAPSLLDELMENIYALGVAVLVLLGLGGYGLFAWRRKKAAGEAFAPTGGEPAEPISVFGSAGRETVDTSLSEEQPAAGEATVAEVEEIDPIAEADVYMAYGRDAQAEEILREALAKDASRTGVRLKLLEVYAGRKDLQAFQAEASELQAITGGHGAEWEKALVLGQQLDPGNPLYGGGPEATAEATAGADMATTTVTLAAAETAETASAETASAETTAVLPIDFDLDLNLETQAVAQGEVAPKEALAVPQGAGAEFDLDLGDETTAGEGKTTPFKPEATVAMPKPATAEFDAQKTVVLPRTPLFEQPAPAPASVAPGATIDFDLDLGAAPVQPGQAEPPATQAPGNVIDFDLRLDDEPAKPVSAPGTAAPDLDLSTIKLDLGGEATLPGMGVDAKWQEVATKLDLAKAYEEMGDKEGARDLLNEVIKEGDAAQQQQAKGMLEALT